MSDFLNSKEVIDAESKEGIDESTMTQLAGLVKLYDEYSEIVVEAERKLKAAKENFNRISLQEIPNFLLSHGITEMKLIDGRKVTVKEDISVTVRDDMAFRKWLMARDEEDIIKTNYKMARMEGNKLSALTDFLIDHDYDFQVDESIHSATKKKYFKELINDIGRAELPEWVSIYDIRSTKIK